MLPYDRLLHADWSVTAAKCWCASATRLPDGWRVDAPELFGDPRARLTAAAAAAASGLRVLMAYDFPIGVPAGYGRRTGLTGFRDLLGQIGTGAWAEFENVAATPSEIAIGRPFYPMAFRPGITRRDLMQGLNVPDFDTLLRRCDRANAAGRSANVMFWTLGGAQVGKAALAGWRDIVRPALAAGARLWPNDGTLSTLAVTPAVVIAESYPAISYRMVGAPFAPGQSKRRQSDRAAKAPAIHTWAVSHTVHLTPAAVTAIDDGHGTTAAGEDAFDALMGVLKLIAVCNGHQPERSQLPNADEAPWEGWIIGR